MKLLIIRHADPDYKNNTLTETGWEEAALLAQRLSGVNISAFYCSPMGRAKDTASLTLKAKNAEAEILPWLREVWVSINRPDRGKSPPFDWMPKDWTTCPQFYSLDRWLEHPVFEENQMVELVTTVYNGIDGLLARHGYARENNLYRAVAPNEDTIVIFSHFGLECLILSRILGISPMVLWHSTCALTSSITTLVTEERQEGIACFRMIGFSDVSHLIANNLHPSDAGRYCEMYANMHQRH